MLSLVCLLILVYQCVGCIQCINRLIKFPLTTARIEVLGVKDFLLHDISYSPALIESSFSRRYRKNSGFDRVITFAIESEDKVDSRSFDDGSKGTTNHEDKNIDGSTESDNAEIRLQRFMIDAIVWYKTTLSPVLPPRCRFLPSCSSYGLESIKKFGPWKGGILTAWRILRCNPSGGTGYDPPQWPPPGYFAGSTTKKRNRNN